MLGYEWGTSASSGHSPPPPQLILTDHDPSSSSSSHHRHHHNHHRPIFDDPFSTPCTFPHANPPPDLYHHHLQQQAPQIPLYGGESYFHHQLAAEGGGGVVVVPKVEQAVGLNLGGRTYFAAADDDLVSRLYRRSRAAEVAANSPRCQAEGCNADLTHAKHYHRRHKVCEFHSKAATVVAAGLTQRFCQQCSRFHLLSEFDNGKRSCRKRLADHNRRRRKSHQLANRDHRNCSYSENARTSPSPTMQRSPSDSGANSSSSVTVAISPSRVSFDSSFRQRSYE